MNENQKQELTGDILYVLCGRCGLSTYNWRKANCVNCKESIQFGGNINGRTHVPKREIHYEFIQWRLSVKSNPTYVCRKIILEEASEIGEHETRIIINLDKLHGNPESNALTTDTNPQLNIGIDLCNQKHQQFVKKLQKLAIIMIGNGNKTQLFNNLIDLGQIAHDMLTMGMPYAYGPVSSRPNWCF